ncbi:phenylalanyl-tRNA synthetase subunit beta [Intrasporangium oryzae NRRL B-24470]|uniref:Phenylalanine--tRNA ligase beta subunit n=1 Tax=Intrasporangium oryzae NRRL B-24470 TaxID=1386089 RepID=W9G4Y1_9MICO|nr:phenylalanine--tRNA ligase subunit beta [Intrasporangium oryzae]EWT01201.1 phenylalanyl-tRNA synthetase subunit beta [Intrasporangium oryzae NRRL B-24470]
MRMPLSWLAEYTDLAPGARGADVAASLVSVGLEEEDLHGGDLKGPLVVGRVLDFVVEPQKNGKKIRWCTVDVGQNGQMLTEGKHQEIVCGAHNFEVGDLVVVVLPGAVLPGNFEIAARKTYGHVSNGMICAEDEIGLGHDHEGIIVLSRLLGEEKAAALSPGDDAIALLGLGEETVETNVTPDRGYCFSVRGLAREYWHAQGSPRGGYRDPAAIAVPAPNGDGYTVELKDETPLEGNEGCDRYVARIVRGIDPSRPSPSWMQKRLTQMGMRPISLAVDVTNYVMLAVGQPLHAFDVDRLSGSIVVRRARAGETLTTLDDVERTLSPEDLLITDGGEHPLAIAGVMGGASSEVAATTTDVLVEAAHFDPTTVARSARRHRLATEASKRFERGVDPKVTAAAAQLAVDLLVEHGGGTPDPGVTDVDHTTDRAAYRLDVTEPSRIVGVDYPRERVLGILRDLGCEVVESGEGADDVHVLVTPPSWRPDLVDAPDYAEEIARIDGYNNIPSVTPTPSGGRGLTHSQKARRVVADALAGAGLTEVLSYPFVSEELADQLMLPADDDRRNAVRLANPLSEERPLLRTSILASLVDTLRRNVARGHKDVAIYELGLVFRPGGPLGTAPIPSVASRPDAETLERLYAAVPAQPRRVGILATGLIEQAGWWGPGRPADWSDMVAAVQAVSAALAVPVVVANDAAHAPWHPGRCARITLADGTLVGHAGELHPKVLAALDLPARTVAAELDVDVLVRASEEPVQARSFSTFPPAMTDVALLVRSDVAAADVEAALRSAAGDALESIVLFDVYEGERVEAGHRSLAYRLTFRAADRTLTTEEVNGFRDAAVAAAAARTGAVQR